MKLWKISQTVNLDYDTYDSAVVAAETEDQARNTKPDGTTTPWSERFTTWAYSPEQVKVEYLGEAPPDTKPGVICASFNAG